MFNYRQLSESEKREINDKLLFSPEEFMDYIMSANSKQEYLSEIANYSMAMQIPFIVEAIYHNGENPQNLSKIANSQPVLRINQFCKNAGITPPDLEYYAKQAFEELVQEETRKTAQVNKHISVAHSREII